MRARLQGMRGGSLGASAVARHVLQVVRSIVALIADCPAPRRKQVAHLQLNSGLGMSCRITNPEGGTLWSCHLPQNVEPHYCGATMEY